MSTRKKGRLRAAFQNIDGKIRHLNFTHFSLEMCACELQSSSSIGGPDSAFIYHISRFPPNAKSCEMSPYYTPQLFVWLAEFVQKLHSVFFLLNEVPSMLISKNGCSFWALFILKMGSFFPFSPPPSLFFINMSTLFLNIKGFSRNQFYHFCLVLYGCSE